MYLGRYQYKVFFFLIFLIIPFQISLFCFGVILECQIAGSKPKYSSNLDLKSLVKNKEVKCEGKDKDRYGRIIGICYADEINLNSTIVKEGWAIAYRYYSKDYVKEEEMAKKDKKGIWQGSFEEPYIWRKNN